MLTGAAGKLKVSRITGIDNHPAVSHRPGITVFLIGYSDFTTGQTGVVGFGCVIYPCTLGGLSDKVRQRHPRIGNFVKIGTDEDECVEGGSGVADYYRHHVASTRNFTIETQHLNVHERDTAAWFYTRQIWTLEWQGRPEVLAMRLTGVLEKESENWKFVQIHASLGQPVAQG